MHGLSPEFSGYREQTAGDDIKNLDWRVYARLDRFYIKRFEDESNLRANIAMGASRSIRLVLPDQARRFLAIQAAVPSPAPAGYQNWQFRRWHDRGSQRSSVCRDGGWATGL
ncbi:MAG: hypothetical protein CMO80_20435 [Verrucomicrobiales bacterium]|nr:hypothetical protein [Verrucomicrobiales bacterium]